MPEATDLYDLCTSDDEFVREAVRWVAVLDDGTTVYQDDGRPGVEPASAWIRLKSYCEEQSRSIVHLKLQFRTHHVPLPSYKRGYSFAKTASVEVGGEAEFGVRVGWLEGPSLYTAKYAVPELVKVGADVRMADPTSLSLIINPGGPLEG